MSVVKTWAQAATVTELLDAINDLWAEIDHRNLVHHEYLDAHRGMREIPTMGSLDRLPTCCASV